MEHLGLERDYEYFKALWEYKKSPDFKHTPAIWDSRAEDWEKELAQDGPFRRSLLERIGQVSDYLRTKGLLGAGSEVLDIGCGPGWFVTDFAATAGHATGIDLSPRMIEVGKNHAADCGRDNVSFLAGDFAALDIQKLAWEAKFDLVFTSITPAIGTMETLEKAMKISRGYCFNSCFVRWEDELEKRIGREVFGIEDNPSPESHGQSFYALFNLLWLMGYLPETSFHLQEQSEYVDANEDLARYYAKCFTSDMMTDEATTGRVYEYLQTHAEPDGTILRAYKRWYGWTLWDVRTRMEQGYKK